MFDFVSLDRSFYLKRQDSFTSPVGGILTLILLLISIIIFYLTGGFSPTSVITSTEYNLSEDEIKNISAPEIKIIYGFPSNISKNLEVIIQKNGIRNIIPLQDYTNEMWNQYFNKSKNPDYIYKFHYWPNTSFLQVIDQSIIPNPKYKPTNFYCNDKTQIQTPLRLNEYGDLECFGTDEVNCEWNMDTREKCDEIINKEFKNLNPLSCGIQHLKLWAMDGYSSPTHWCTIGRQKIIDLNPGIEFDSWDESLWGKRIFVALEQTKYNDRVNSLEKNNIILSDIDDPNNYIISLKRKTSRVKINNGFFRLGSEYKYSSYATFATKLIRKIPKNVYFHYNIVDNINEIVEKRSKEITFDLTIDLIAKIFSLISPVIFVIYLLNKLINEYLFCKFILSNYKPLKNKKIYPSWEKILIESDKKIFTFANFLKNKFIVWEKNRMEGQKFYNLYESILEVISIERLYAEDIKLPPENLSKTQRFLKKMDYLAPKRDLYINQNTNFETKIGKFLTLFYLGFVIYMLYYLGVDFFRNTNPLKIIYPQEISYDVDYKLLYQSIPIMFYYPSWADPYLKFIYNNRSVNQLNYTIMPDYMMPHKCSDDEINNYEHLKRENYVYYCSDILNFIDPIKTNDNSIKIGLGKCSNMSLIDSKITNCLNSENINDLIDLNILIKSWIVNENSQKNEYKHEEIVMNSYQNSFLNNPKNYTLFTNTLTHYIWTEDGSIFIPTDQSETFHVVSYNEVSTPNYISPEHNFIFTLFSFTLENRIKNVTRSFSKFLILWNKVFLAASLFLYILYFIYYFLEDYFFMRTFSDLYFNKDSRSMSKTIRSLRFSKMISPDLSSPSIRHEMKSKIFCLANHIKMIFCSRNYNVKKYKIVQKELLDSLSFERIALNNEESINITFFDRFDFLTDNRLFLLNKKQFFRTILGGILTIIFVLLCIIFGYLIGEEFFNRTNPSVSITSLYYSERDLEYWPNQSLPIMLYITKVPNYPSYFILNDQITETMLQIEEDSCTPEFFELLKVKKSGEYRYGCIDIFNIMGKNHKLYKNNKYISFGITTCQEWASFKIFEYQNNPKSYVNHPCPNETIKSNEEIEAGVYIKFKFFKKEISGLVETIINEKTIDTNGDLYSLKFDIWGNQLEDDTEWFLPNIETYFFISLTSLLKQRFKGFNNGLFGRLSVSIYQNEDYYTLYERKYMKFMDYFVNLSTIVITLFAIFRFIYKFYNNFSFLQYYQKFYFEICKSKENIKNQQNQQVTEKGPSHFSINQNSPILFKKEKVKHNSFNDLPKVRNENKARIMLKTIEIKEIKNHNEQLTRLTLNKLEKMDGDTVSLSSINLKPSKEDVEQNLSIPIEPPSSIAKSPLSIAKSQKIKKSLVDFNAILKFKQYLSSYFLVCLEERNKKFNETMNRLIEFYSVETLYKKSLRKSDFELK